jgi:two-component system C4-dicarboxylate transport sensor histidine kinase DctB
VAEELDIKKWIPNIEERLEKLHRLATAGLCINGVIHETNNYLGAIMAYAELLQMETSPGEESHRMLGKIIDCVQDCSLLMNGLNTISRSKDSLITLVEIPELINTVYRLRKYYQKILKIWFEMDIEENIKPIVVDLPRIQLALINILKNAEENLELKEATEKDPRRLKITCTADDNRVSIIIKDNGPPVPVDYLDQIFSQFTTTKNQYHLGLGLAIANKMIKEHNGILKYSPEEGFTIWIPFDNPKVALLHEEVS